MLDDERIDQSPGVYLNTVGHVFAVFDDKTQDSGNISYGVQIGSERYFVKTAGLHDDPKPFLNHEQRVLLLRNAIRLARGLNHPLLPRLHHLMESPCGPMLFYDWVDGELLRKEVLKRFRRLPVDEILNSLDAVYELHHQLAGQGWIASDFYDGSMLYDFESHRLHLIDLDHYHEGAFTNEMGRMFGSSRFMAPEEFELGAPIDERTTVFTMGRTAAVLLSDGTLNRQPFRGSDAQYDVILRACRNEPNERFATMGEFFSAWANLS